jgi:coenzyme F420-0:L-glutamate ligase / coenzyme F420-1:gamma-L-glutamate ligase
VIELLPVAGVPRLAAGDDLGAALLHALRAAPHGLRDGDVVVCAQKAVSKCEGREVVLDDVVPSARAIELAGDDGDPRVVELVLRESVRIVRRRGHFLVCETRHGFVCASAGVDRSNATAPGRAVLLPLDPDASARALRAALAPLADVAVIVSDSFGRPFRRGTTGVALGCAGIAPLRSYTGLPDDVGKVLEGTEVHVADQLASAAELVLGPIGGTPAVVVRGASYPRSEEGAASGLIPPERDLFRFSTG